MNKVSPALWDGFAENASPEAIASYLTAANAERRRIDRYIIKLENLLERRTAEKAAGTWPTNSERRQP